MKYLKLFEAWMNNPIFYRRFHVDILNGEKEGEFQPIERKFNEICNSDLISRGFPDMNKSIHLMGEGDTGEDRTSIWGDILYEVKIDDNSTIGWTFLLNINDWYYRSNPYRYCRNENLIKNLEERTNMLEIEPYNTFDDNLQVISQITDCLLSEKIIGTGKISDLMKSTHYGKYRYFIWTTDKVYLKRL